MTETIIGIDLGSYNSTVSVYQGGEVTVIPNSEGSNTTPSIVAFTKDGIKVGEPAKRQASVNPVNTIFNIKRLMGKTYDQVKHLKRPYKIVDNKGRAAVEVDGRVYSPEEISAIVLQKMKKTAEDFVGHTIEKAIITVPAHFNSQERESTKVAGEIAGLKVERIISEPTAAVLNVDKQSAKKYAVYDFGGQTMDLSIVDVGDGVFEILSTDGDIDLGGSIIDQSIVDWIAEEFKSEFNMDLRQDKMALQRLFEAAEKAKIELSNSNMTDINLPYITSIDNVPRHLVKTLSRAKFEQIAEPIIDRTITKAKSALESSGLSSNDIDQVLLVGGSSRIPLVQDKLEKLFGKKPSKTLNPDLCVSMGATIQGGVLSGQVSDILLVDVLPLSIGLETNGGVFTKMIEANTTIPFSKSQVFSTAVDNQPSVEIHVLQGERSMARDNKTLGRFFLDGILPAMRGVPQIEITFDVDANNILHVKALDKGTGKEQKIRIESSSSLSPEEIERMKQDAKDNEAKDKEAKEAADIKNNADSLVFQTEKQVKELGDKLNQEDKDSLDAKVKTVKDAISSGDTSAIKSATDALTDTWQTISAKLYSTDNGNCQNCGDDNCQTGGDKTSDAEFEEVK